MKSILEVAFDLPNDGNPYFRAAGYCLRGRRDFMRIAAHQPSAVTLYSEFPRGIPSTLLRIDLDEESVTLIEPLRTAEYAPEAEKLRAKGIEIPLDVEFEHAQLPDWLHEVKRLLNAGHAKIVKGELPKDLGQESERPRLSPEEKSEDRIERLCDVVEKLVESLPGLLKAAASK